MPESYPKSVEILSENEKLLFTNNFIFSHSVFERFVLQTTKKTRTCLGKGFDSKTIQNEDFDLTDGDKELL